MKDYLEHLTLLDLKKDKRKKERLAKKSAEASKTYQEYDWNAMFKDGVLSKQAIAVIDKYLKHHGLRTAPNKHAKLMEVQRHIIQQQIQSFTQEEASPLCSSENEEEYLSSDDKSVQTDYIFAKIGSSSEDDDDDEGDGIQITVQLLHLGGGLLAICYK